MATRPRPLARSARTARSSRRCDPIDPVWWATTSIGTAATTVQRVWWEYGVAVRAHDRQGAFIDEYGRWRPGHADRMTRTFGRATTWQRTTTWARRLSRGGVVLPGVFQSVEDVSDPSLTTGHRISRAGSAVLLEGGEGSFGGKVGVAGGAALGGLIGGPVGAGIDTVIDGARDLGSSTIDKVTDVGGSVQDTVSGWFS